MIRQSLILLCEAHFAILYIIQIDLVFNYLEQTGSLSLEIISQLGLLESDSSWDFLEIALLVCLCAVHNHGFEMLFSFSAIVQHAPCLPFGFSILKAGLNKLVLLSVYASSTIRDSHTDGSYEETLTEFLSKATGTTVDWVQMPGMKPGPDSVGIFAISHRCSGVAAHAYDLVIIEPLKIAEIHKDRPFWFRDCRSLEVFTMFPARNGGPIELV
ncbi:Homeobox-leucine zipper protein REVOLUTA [Camellia lanceoleosa]|uniref:Homeobox-leucine zipper protein REVOLUTA n=1 Tax=Camellia lanceoleosa TaxID=1840588 RepID=A0ACC0F4N2_9ERIC|nr:Homeobox-leucine zipper protein REVOLUTA [Camellia lanceoleosa]